MLFKSIKTSFFTLDKHYLIAYLNPTEGIAAAEVTPKFVRPPLEFVARADGISKGESTYFNPFLSFSGILISSAVFFFKSALKREPFGECLLNKTTYMINYEY